MQAKLRTAREHAVRLGHTLGDQVVDQHTQVSLITPRQPGLVTATLQRRIDAGKQSLRGSLLVAGSAIDLTRKKQPVNSARLEATFQFARIEVVVFDGVAGPQDMRVFQAGH